MTSEETAQTAAPSGAPVQLPALESLSLAEAKCAALWPRLPVKLKTQIVDQVLLAMDANYRASAGSSSTPRAVGFFAEQDTDSLLLGRKVMCMVVSRQSARVSTARGYENMCG